MASENAKIKVRNRILEIKFVAQYCDHIMDNYINQPATHDLKFQEIVNVLKRANYEHQKGRIWRARGEHRGVRYVVYLIIVPKFAIVKTCYRYGGQ